MNVTCLIRGNNIVWECLYYDELLQVENCQLSYFRYANEDYYNVAHAVTKLSKDDLGFIEDFYRKRGVSPAFYVDPVSDIWLSPVLSAAGYVEVVSQEENWWVIELNQDTVRQLSDKNFLKYDLASVKLDTFNGGEELDEFIKIDQETNFLTKEIAASLKKNIVSKISLEVYSYYFLGKVDNLPAFCGYMGIYQDTAYFAEDGTLEKYRRGGLQTYMTQERLNLAFSRGVKQACITCRPDAYTNKTVENLGFSLAFKRRLFKKCK